jgi:WD40 repeat protein
MSAEIGQVLKGYELKGQIGAGAFGAVYRAVQPQLDREVAIKVILPEHANRPNFIRRFEAEAHLVAQLEHLHIVPLYDYWREPDGAYLVMRLMQGGSLEDALHDKSLDLSTVSRIVDQIGAALTAAHHKGVIHRDLKPANILLDEEGNAYLSDFGIAKDLRVSEGLTGTGSILGSPAYLAPEQVQSQPISPQTDIYSLGVVLYELLAGQHPFPDTPVGALMLKQVNQLLPCVNECSPDLPAGLDAVVQRSTAKDPADRYSDLNEFADAFRAALGEQPVERFLTAEEAAALANPYKGLRAFQEADTADFFGREALTGQLLARLLEPGDASRFLAVVGPSGSGKSSVLRAGLIPALRKGALPGSQDWFIVEMVPGVHPLEKLALGLERISVNPRSGIVDLLQKDENGILLAARLSLPSDEDRLLLVIDQFEELFTLAEDPSSVEFFLDGLHTAICDPNSPLRVILTLRADFYDRPLMHAVFGGLVEQRTQVVLPLTGDELGDAIRSPCERVGAVLEEGLVTKIVADLGEQPGALPLLQYALTELFERREGLKLTADAYREIGGVLGGLGRRAEEIYSGLETAEQDNARQLYLRLVTLGEGVEDTRRRVLQSELEGLRTAEVEISDVLDAFGEARLLTFDRDPITRGPTVEVAHEALLREWPRLREWLNESRTDLRIQRLLGRGAREWQASKQDASFLLRGTRLEQYAGWADETTIALTEHELAYLDAGLEAKQVRDAEEADRQERELALEKRSRSILRALVGVFALAAVVAVVLTAFAFSQRDIAKAQSDGRATQQAVAEEQQAIAEQEARAALEAFSISLSANAKSALANHDPSTALMLAVAANSIAEPPLQAVQVLREAAYAPGPRRRYVAADLFKGVTGDPVCLDIGPDGLTALTGFSDGNIILWDLETGTELRRFSGHTARVYDIVFSPDGKTMLSGSDDGLVILWELEGGQIVHRMKGHSGWVRAVDFSPDGRMAVSGGFAGRSFAEISHPGELILWDLVTGREIRRFGQTAAEGYIGHANGIQAVSFVPGSQMVLASSGIWTMETAILDYRLILWDVATGEMVRELQVEGEDNYSLAVSPDGKTALTATSAGDIVRWDLATGQKLQTLSGHRDNATSVAFSPNGRMAVSGAWDDAVILWDLQSGEPLLNIIAHESGWGEDATPLTVAVGPDGRQALSTSEDGIIILWDLFDAGEVRRFDGHQQAVADAAFTPDGKQFLSGGGRFSLDGESIDNQMRLWDLETGELVRVFDGHTDTIVQIDISPDGKRALTGSFDGSMRLWDLKTGAELRQFADHVFWVFQVAFSPDGRTGISSTSGESFLWDLETGELLHQLPDTSWTIIHFNPDGRTVYISSDPEGLNLWDLETGQVIQRWSPNSWFDFAVMPGGKTILTYKEGGTALLWDLETDQEVRLFTGHSSFRSRFELTPDGRYVLFGDWDGTLLLRETETWAEIRRFRSVDNGFIFDVAISPDGRMALVPGSNGAIVLWDLTLPIEGDDVRAWIDENRYVREPTCEERETFSILPLCGEEDLASLSPSRASVFLLVNPWDSGVLTWSLLVAAPLAFIYFKRHKYPCKSMAKRISRGGRHDRHQRSDPQRLRTEGADRHRCVRRGLPGCPTPGRPGGGHQGHPARARQPPGLHPALRSRGAPGCPARTPAHRTAVRLLARSRRRLPGHAPDARRQPSRRAA